MPDSDVIVVGAGPSGSTAARLLAEAGASVVLIDRENFPRDKCCAGWVNALAFKEFPELQRRSVDFVENPFRGIVFLSPDLSGSVAHTEGEIAGYQVKRPVFDTVLLEMARAAGAMPLTGEAVVSVTESDTEAAVRTESGKTLSARILVGADGANSCVARSLGLLQEIPAKDFALSTNENVEIGEDRVVAAFGEARPIHIAIGYRFMSGYAWVFPKRSSVAVGLGGRGMAAEKARALHKQFFSDLRDRHLIPDGVESGSCQCGIGPVGAALKAKSHTSRRAILVGDAGGFVSAASGEGIYPGMLSAKLAVEPVLAALKAIDPRKALAEFNAAWPPRLRKYLTMPSISMTFIMPMLFSDKRVTAKVARGFLFGEKL